MSSEGSKNLVLEKNPAQATCLGKSHLAKASSRQAKTGRQMKPELRNRMGRGQGDIRMGFPCTAARSGKGKAHWPDQGEGKGAAKIIRPGICLMKYWETHVCDQHIQQTEEYWKTNERKCQPTRKIIRPTHLAQPSGLSLLKGSDIPSQVNLFGERHRHMKRNASANTESSSRGIQHSYPDFFQRE